MTVLGINPQKLLPARGFVAVPFFALHNEHCILAYKSGGEKDQVRRGPGESHLPGTGFCTGRESLTLVSQAVQVTLRVGAGGDSLASPLPSAGSSFPDSPSML